MAEQQRPPQLKVLVIDDEPNNCHIVSEILDGDYQVLTATSGEEGLLLATEQHPGLVILDLMMPDMDGYEVCRRLRQFSATASTPVLFVSALSQTHDKLAAYRAGGDDYLAKPFNIKELRAKVNVLMQRQAAHSMQVQKLVDLMPHGITLRDTNGTLLLVNQRFADFYGHDKQALVGRSIGEVIRDDTLVGRLLTRDRKVLQEQGGPTAFEELLSDGDGKPHYMHITKTEYSFAGHSGVLTVSTDISARKEIECTLNLQRKQLSEAEHLAGIGSWEWDIANDSFHWSDNLYRLLGLTRAELPTPSWDTTSDCFLPEEYPQIRSRLETALHGDGVYDLEHSMVRSDGCVIEVHAKAVSIKDESGQPNQMRGTVQDITERKRQEARQRLTALMFEQMADMVIITDPASNIVDVNTAFTRITGYSREDAIGTTPALLKSQHHDGDFYRALWQQLVTQGSWQGEIWNRRKNGSLYPSWLSVSALTDSQGVVSHYVGISRDLSGEKEAKERLYYLTNYDIQTGLPNRTLLTRELEEAIDLSREEAGTVALVAVRVNDFDLVNDSLGHVQGDAYIAEVGERLRALSPWPKGVGRIDTYNLGIVLPQLRAAKDALPLLQQILGLNQQWVMLQSQDVPVSLSIGLSLFPNDGHQAQRLVEQALIAVDQGLRQGRGTFEFYANGMNNQAHERLQIQADLHKALKNDEFFLQYQPKLEFNSGEVIGAEALVRWRHPQQGFIPPSDFIPVAEACGLIRELGAWVLRQACRQAKTWQDSGLLSGPMAINLSALQLQDSALVSFVNETLEAEQLPAHCLELEITESVLMDTADQAVETLKALRQLGIGLSLDDFGTGHSSLHYLSRLPVNKIKIDRSFVQRFEDYPEDALIIKSILGMARGLGLTTVAEGVETASQCASLKKLRCDELQGYYFCKPLSASDLEHFLSNKTASGEFMFTNYQHRTLLVIDDEPNILHSLRRLLRRENYELLMASSVAEAKELLAKHEIQVVVCDQRMPGMSGSEFFHELKQTYPGAVRIMLSGYTEFTAISDAVNRGEVYKYVTKPWEDSELLETLRNAFDKYDIEN